MSEIEDFSDFFFVAYGVKIGIRANDSNIFKYLSDYLPPKYEETLSMGVDVIYSLITSNLKRKSCYQIYRARKKLIETLELEEALDCLDSDLRLQIAMFTKDRLFVHAGVVGWNGKAIVIPGRSFSGKTTLVAALVKAGATYYSDEYAVFDTKGIVYPYSRPLSIRQSEKGKVKRYPIEKLGGKAGTKPLAVGLVAYTNYESKAEWKPIEMSPGQAVLALLDNTIVARLRPKFALPILSKAVSNVLSLEGKRGEVTQTAAALLQQI